MMTCFGLLGLIMFCEPVKQPVATDSFCRVARIIRPSRRDTGETKRQILAHNRKVKELCLKKRSSR